MPLLAEILKSKIGKHGKSKASVAAELNVSEKTIENYMNGKREPKQAALTRLAKFLDFSLSELSEQNVPIGRLEMPQNSTILGKDVQNSDLKEGENSGALSQQALFNMTVSDKERAIAEKERALAEKDRAAAELLRERNNEKIIEKLTAGDRPKKTLVEITKAKEFLAIIAKIGSGKKVFHSESQGLSELNKFVPEYDPEILEDGTPDGLGKRYKSG